MKRYLEVVECETDRVIDRVDVTDKSEKQAERVMDGVDRYLNHERYYTRFSAISYMPGVVIRAPRSTCPPQSGVVSRGESVS